MNSRERVIAALNHQQPDRCPIDLGSNGQTGMNVSTMYKFRKALGLDEHRLNVLEPFQMLGEVEDDLRRAVGGDVIGLWNTGNMLGYQNDHQTKWQLGDGTPVFMGSKFTYDVRENGDTLVYPQGDRSVKPSVCMPANGSFFDSIDHFEEAFDMDLDEDQLTPLEDFRDDFALATDEEARYWETKSHELFEGTEYAVMGVLGGAGLGDVAMVPGPSVKHPKGIRKVEEWLLAHVLYPDYINEIFSYQTEIMLKNLEIYRQAVGNRIQVIWVSGTDFGTQNGTFTSLDTFRRLYKPYYSQINNWIHQNTEWKTFYHTCGRINTLLDDFAQIGVDCLNPVQFSAIEHGDGFSPAALKEKYGDKFVFWGGGVDTQRTLPFGTPEEVRKEVQQRVEILNQGGGYVFASIHNVVAKVPPENLLAMYEAVLGKKLPYQA